MAALGAKLVHQGLDPRRPSDSVCVCALARKIARSGFVGALRAGRSVRNRIFRIFEILSTAGSTMCEINTFKLPARHARDESLLSLLASL